MTNHALRNPGVKSLGPLPEAQIIGIWLVLTIATCLCWWLGTDHGLGNPHRVSSTIILMIAFIKIRLIGLYFMELRHGPVVLQRIFDGFCLVVCAVLIATYLMA